MYCASAHKYYYAWNSTLTADSIPYGSGKDTWTSPDAIACDLYNYTFTSRYDTTGTLLVYSYSEYLGIVEHITFFDAITNLPHTVLTTNVLGTLGTPAGTITYWMDVYAFINTNSHYVVEINDFHCKWGEPGNYVGDASARIHMAGSLTEGKGCTIAALPEPSFLLALPAFALLLIRTFPLYT